VAAARGETAGDASLLDLSAVLVFGFALDAPAGADAGVGGAVAVGAGLARLWGTFRSAESVAMGASVGSEYRSMTHPWFAGSDARLPL
jgi:acyl dehydratase